MKNLFFSIIIFSVIPFFHSFADDHTTNFPKHEEQIKELPAKHNFWIFILAGQSNMAGRGLVSPEDTIPHPRILTVSKDTTWIYAKSPLHFYEPTMTGLGSGMSFAKALITNIPDSVIIGLVPCAVGGCNIQQWLGDSLHRGVHLQSNLLDKIDLANNAGTIKGILWHQGEGDAKSDRINRYYGRADTLFSLMRSYAANDTLPVILGELGTFTNEEKKHARFDSVNVIINAYAQEHEHTSVIHTGDLWHKGDHLHFNATGQRIMGVRYAEEWLKYYQQK